jgi:hypothetical protein
MSVPQFSLIHPDLCDPFGWMDTYVNSDSDTDSSIYSYSEDSIDFSDLYYVKQLGSLNLDSIDHDDLYELSSPIPQLHKTGSNNCYPDFEIQMENIYGLKKGKKYCFDENYSLLYKKNKNNNINKNNNKNNKNKKTKKTFGIFDGYVNTDIFRFIVDEKPYLVNRRNFSAQGNQLREPTVPLKPLP